MVLKSVVIPIMISLISAPSDRVRLAAVKSLASMCTWFYEYRMLIVQLKPYERILQQLTNDATIGYRCAVLDFLGNSLFLSPRPPKPVFQSASATLSKLYKDPSVIVQRSLVNLSGVTSDINQFSRAKVTTFDEFQSFLSVGYPAIVFNQLESPYILIQNAAMGSAAAFVSAGPSIFHLYEKECLPKVLKLYQLSGNTLNQQLALTIMRQFLTSSKFFFIKSGVGVLDLIEKQLLDENTPESLLECIMNFLYCYADYDPDPKNLVRRGFIVHLARVLPRLKKCEQATEDALNAIAKMIQQEKKIAFYEKVKQVDGWTVISGLQKHKNSQIAIIAKAIMKKVNG
jgi:hypothetical protein